MISEQPFEDTWQDIVSKAMRGLQLDAKALAQRSTVSEEKIQTLLEGKRNDATLVAIAPALRLHPRELVMMAAETTQAATHKLPRNFKRFTTLYHGMQVHSYLLWSEKNKKAVAFDTGADDAPILEMLDQHQLTLDAIFLTHAHGDHVCKLSELIKKTGASAWIDPAELIRDTHPLLPDFSYHLDDAITLEIRRTPGHSIGGSTYVIHGLATPVAVVGDAIFARSVGGMAPEFYLPGLEKICDQILMLNPITILAPGHGPLTTVQEERDQNPFFA